MDEWLDLLPFLSKEHREWHRRGVSNKPKDQAHGAGHYGNYGLPALMRAKMIDAAGGYNELKDGNHESIAGQGMVEMVLYNSEMVHRPIQPPRCITCDPPGALQFDTISAPRKLDPWMRENPPQPTYVNLPFTVPPSAVSLLPIVRAPSRKGPLRIQFRVRGGGITKSTIDSPSKMKKSLTLLLKEARLHAYEAMKANNSLAKVEFAAYVLRVEELSGQYERLQVRHTGILATLIKTEFIERILADIALAFEDASNQLLGCRRAINARNLHRYAGQIRNLISHDRFDDAINTLSGAAHPRLRDIVIELSSINNRAKAIGPTDPDRATELRRDLLKRFLILAENLEDYSLWL